MPSHSPTKPVEDSVAKVDDDIAVGSDLKFQQGWWRFETAAWTIFAILVLAAALGAFGRGYLSHHRIGAPDGSLTVDYERVQRYATPSVLTVQFGPNAIRDGKVQLWVSQSVFQRMGNQKVVPTPAQSVAQAGGVLFTFAVSSAPASAEFSLQPDSAGRAEMEFLVSGKTPVKVPVFVMP